MTRPASGPPGFSPARTAPEALEFVELATRYLGPWPAAREEVRGELMQRMQSTGRALEGGPVRDAAGVLSCAPSPPRWSIVLWPTVGGVLLFLIGCVFFQGRVERAVHKELRWIDPPVIGRLANERLEVLRTGRPFPEHGWMEPETLRELEGRADNPACYQALVECSIDQRHALPDGFEEHW
ncbi:MAG: hypothetical protein JWO82_732, partial [Akkermansiaceae bacterium]|nr:hypothetical protein [Akkermansiaceae bacterium]